MSLAAPNLAISKVAKLPGINKLVSGAGKVLGKVSDVAETIPAIYKPIETFSPYFRRPEVGKIVQELKSLQLGELIRCLIRLQIYLKGLTREQQIEVGKIIEGAKSNDKQLVAIARQAQNLGSSIGQG